MSVDDGLLISAEGDLMISAAGDALVTVDGKCAECGCGQQPGDGPCCQIPGWVCDYLKTAGPFNASVTADVTFFAAWASESRFQFPGAYQDLNARLLFGGDLDGFAAPCGGNGSGSTNWLEITNVPGQDGVIFPYPDNNRWIIDVFGSTNVLNPKDRLSVQIRGSAFTAPVEGYPGTGSSFNISMGVDASGSVFASWKFGELDQTMQYQVNPVYSGLCLIGLDVTFSYFAPQKGTAPNVSQAAVTVSGTIGVRFKHLKGCGQPAPAATWAQISEAWE